MIYIWAKKGHLFFVAMTVLLFNLRYWMLFAWLFYLLSMGIVGTIYWLATYKPF